MRPKCQKVCHSGPLCVIQLRPRRQYLGHMYHFLCIHAHLGADVGAVLCHFVRLSESGFPGLKDFRDGPHLC